MLEEGIGCYRSDLDKPAGFRIRPTLPWAYHETTGFFCCAGTFERNIEHGLWHLLVD